MSDNITPPNKSTKQVDSVDKALSILECFSDNELELSLKQLAEKTGLYKSRILRLCGTLIDHGFIIRLGRSIYKLGPRIMVLGKIYERSNSLVSLARPILRELASITGETSKLYVIQGFKRVCLVREKGTFPLSYNVEEGDTFELYTGAGGKALLAYSSKEFRDQVFNTMAIKKVTSAIDIKRSHIEDELAKIREQGYACSSGEIFTEVSGIAAPVFDDRHNVCGALTIAGPTQRFTEDRSREMLDTLLNSTQKLSQLLGYVDNK